MPYYSEFNSCYNLKEKYLTYHQVFQMNSIMLVIVLIAFIHNIFSQFVLTIN